MRYNKLVRDKIPNIIKKDGKIPVTHIASDEEFKTKLYEKLKEETDEFLKNPSNEELADILEVIDSICKQNKIEKDELETVKKQKSKERGGFKDKIILDEVQ